MKEIRTADLNQWVDITKQLTKENHPSKGEMYADVFMHFPISSKKANFYAYMIAVKQNDKFEFSPGYLLSEDNTLMFTGIKYRIKNNRVHRKIWSIGEVIPMNPEELPKELKNMINAYKEAKKAGIEFYLVDELAFAEKTFKKLAKEMNEELEKLEPPEGKKAH